MEGVQRQTQRSFEVSQCHADADESGPQDGNESEGRVVQTDTCAAGSTVFNCIGGGPAVAGLRHGVGIDGGCRRSLSGSSGDLRRDGCVWEDQRNVSMGPGVRG